MSDNWNNFLSNNGASFNQQQEVLFNQSIPHLNEELLLTDLSWLGLIEVRGDDRQTFLQGQLTNDINAVSSSLSQLSGYCTPKGRMRALFSIFSRQTEDDSRLYLQLPLDLLQANLKRLQMFVMMSKVEIKDVSAELIRIGIAGTQAVKYLQQQGLSIPEDVNGITQTDDVTLIRLGGETPRFECVGGLDRIKKLWESLAVNAKYLDTRHWKLLDIHAGIPNVYPETSETFIPQMLNLQALNGINFKKGCYTGQEVVARMQYLGKLKRHMYLAHSNTETVPAVGSQIYSPGSGSGQGDGNIVDAQAALEGGVDMLVVVTNEAFDSQQVFLDEAQQTPVSFRELPYSMES